MMPGARGWTVRRWVAYTRQSTEVNRFPDTADAKYAPHRLILLYRVVDFQDLQVSFWVLRVQTGIGITSLISLGYLTFDASPSARQISDMRSPFFAIRDGNVSFSRSSWMGM